MRPHKLKFGTLVDIYWDDAWGRENGWESFENNDCTPALMRTCGYVRATSKQGVLVGHTLSLNTRTKTEAKSGIGETFRPWGMITKLKVLA